MEDHEPNGPVLLLIALLILLAFGYAGRGDYQDAVEAERTVAQAARLLRLSDQAHEAGGTPALQPARGSDLAAALPGGQP